MEAKELLTIIGMLLTMALSIYALYKAFKITPKEIQSVDADLSTKYQELADRSLARANIAEIKIKELEKVVETYEAAFKDMKSTIGTHETEITALKAEIKLLKERILEQNVELDTLRKTHVAQAAELIELKKTVQSPKL